MATKKRNPDETEIIRSSTIIADRLCGAVADPIIRNAQEKRQLAAISELLQTSVYKGYKQDKIEMRGDRAEMSDFPLYLNMVTGGLDCRDQAIGGFSFVVKIYAVPVVEIIG